MRRPRPKLQVSTFPFLAVLLCAMGSLILFLLVMDRRAKLVARHKHHDLARLAAAARQTQETAYQAEHDRQKDALHAGLVEQQKQLQAEAHTLKTQLADVHKKLEIQQASFLDLQQRTEKEKAQLAATEAALQKKVASVKQTQQGETQARADLVRLSSDVQQLEKTVKDLRALKKQEGKTYSVVPYRGKHGEARKPVYVECRGDGLLLHPDRTPLDGAAFSVQGLRAEVERRTGGLMREKPSGKKREPDGDPAARPYVLFLIRPDGVAHYYKALSFLKGFELDFGSELVDAGWALDFSAVPAASVSPSSPPPPSPDRTTAVAVPPPPTSGNAAPVMTAPRGPALSDGGSSKPPSQERSGPPSGVPATVAPSPWTPTARPAAGGSGFGTPSAGTSLAPSAAVSPTTPSFMPTTKPVPPAAPAVPPMPTPPAVPDHPPGDRIIASAGPTAAAPADSDPLARLSVPAFGKKPAPTKPAPPPLSTMLGNRDFVITVDCYADHVTVFPGGAQFRWKGDARATDVALQQTVSGLIQKRQASVRTGEPPYRPTIRFQVAPDGLRAYYHVYPLLEYLRVPMARENLED